MTPASPMSPARRKRLLATYGPNPAGYTPKDVEQLLDFLYGLFSHQYTLTELRQMRLSDPFDRSESPRQLSVVDLAEWLEALLS